MKRFFLLSTVTLFVLGSGVARAKLSPQDLQKLPPPASHQIDFTKEIKPIFEESCIKCHGRGRTKGDFSIESRVTLLKGGENGPVIVPGQSAESYLVHLVSGLDPDEVMPQKGKRLTPAQVGLVRAWIDQGATWDANISFAKPPPVNLFPRHPQLPPASGDITNPIDRLLQPYFAAHGVKPSKPVDDRVFARRVYLDVIGLLPTPAQLEQFLADRRPDRRERLVRQLLSDNLGYAGKWLTFWNDLLRNDYQGTGYIDGGREQITAWLYASLASNKPFDQFVRELINPVPESEGFIKGIVWRGSINASQTPQMQAAQNISQVFMGVNLKCASCHDSFINDWMLSDSYGLAGIYTDHPLETVRCDKPTGKIAKVKFIYPELGAIDPNASKAERMKQLAEVVASQKDGRLTRTIVNRLWAEFMGRGLIEPLDEMDNAAWDQDVLDWLAADLEENGYDLKKTMERILTSRAYQLPATPIGEQSEKEFVFRGPVVRRLSAEEYLDAISAVTGVWHDSPAAQVDYAQADPRLAETSVEPKWIWNNPGAAEKAPPQTVYFRRIVSLPAIPAEAAAVVTCDNRFQLFVNGREIGSGKDHTRAKVFDVRPHLLKGRNVFAIAAVNDPGNPSDKSADPSNPAGLFFYARIRGPETPQGKPKESVMDVVSDKSWSWSVDKTEGWNQPEFAATDWQAATELGNADVAPWHLGKMLESAIASAALRGEVRASLVNNDPLMTALGRPSREQVVTCRFSTATTLQALELTNGKTLADLLERGASAILQQNFKSSRQLISDVYERGLSRKPTRAELQLAAAMVGSPAQPQGVEDFLWAMTMLPEFQLIY